MAAGVPPPPRRPAPSGDRGSRQHTLLLSVRQGLIIILGGIETYLRLPRSIVPKRKREKPRYLIGTTEQIKKMQKMLDAEPD